nr:hypothetical protein [Streptomyces sp. QL37]PPQ55652.1 hypothetical protein C5F59_02300 [Streptomyces sp. QL37]
MAGEGEGSGSGGAAQESVRLEAQALHEVSSACASRRTDSWAAPPEPEPEPEPSPSPATVRPAPPPAPVALPTYRKATRKTPRTGPSLVSLTLLITAPAVFAVAVLRPRSSR